MPDTDRSPHRQAAYEQRDVKSRHVYLYGAILLVLVVICGVFVDWFFQRLKTGADAAQTPAPAAALRATVQDKASPPAFAMYPARNLAQFRQAEDEFLSSYGWADSQAGKARIPIKRAMALLVEHGLPAVPPAVAAAEKQP